MRGGICSTGRTCKILMRLEWYYNVNFEWRWIWDFREVAYYGLACGSLS